MINENSELEQDHTQGCHTLHMININLKKDLLAGEVVTGTDQMAKSNKKMRKSLHSLKNCQESDKPFEIKANTLTELVDETDKLVDACKTRLSLLDEESTFFRHRYQDLQREYQRLRG